MPIGPDLSIYGSLSRSTPEPSPIQTLGAMMQIKEQHALLQARQLEVQQKTQQLNDDKAKRSALQIYGTPEAAAEALIAQGMSTAGYGLLEEAHKERTAGYQETDANLLSFQRHAAYVAQQIQAVKGKGDAAWQPVRQGLVETLGPKYAGLADSLPTTADDDKFDELITRGKTIEQQTADQRENMSQFQKGLELIRKDYLEGLATGSDARRREAALVQKAGPAAAAQLMGEGGTMQNLPEYSKAALEGRAMVQHSIGQSLLATHTKEQADQVLTAAEQGNAPKDIVQLYRNIPYGPDYNEAVTRLALSVQQRTADEIAAARAKQAQEKAEADAVAAGRRADNADQLTRIREAQLDLERSKYQDKKNNPAPGTPGGPEKPLTPVQKNAEQRRLAAEDKATETWVQTQPQVEGTKAGQSGYELLAPEAKQEYVRRKVEAQDKRRTRVLDLPTFKDAAEKAVENRDKAAYEKLAKEYSQITNGVGNLSDIVAWEDGDTGDASTTTPAAPTAASLTPQQRAAARAAMRGGR